MGAEWTAAALRAEIEAFLEAQHTVTLATVSEDGAAHAASLLYARDGLALVWTSDPATRHSRHVERHLARGVEVAATVAPDYADFRAIRGLQLHGRAAVIADPEGVAAARALMLARYSFLRELASGPPALRAAWEKAAFYRFAPRRIALIDNTRGFGHKAALDIGPAGEITLAPAKG